MVEIMPCGHGTNWMMRNLDRGVRYKLCMACCFLGAGVKEDAYGNKLPLPLERKEPLAPPVVKDPEPVVMGTREEEKKEEPKKEEQKPPKEVVTMGSGKVEKKEEKKSTE